MQGNGHIDELKLLKSMQLGVPILWLVRGGLSPVIVVRQTG